MRDQTDQPGFESKKTQAMPFYYSAVTATLGTVLQYTAIHPIWSAKISKQDVNNKQPLTFSFKNLPVLYRGYWLHVSRALPVSLVQIGAGNFVKAHFACGNRDLTAIYAGVIGGMLSAPIVTATDGIMTQQKFQGGSAIDMAKEIHQRHGMPGFFNGLISTALRNGGRTVSYFALFPAVYEHTFQASAEHIDSVTERRVIANAVATIIAGAFATVVTNPPDVIKTVQQNALLDKHRANLMGMVEATKVVYAKKGMSGFVSGLSNRFVSRSLEVLLMGLALQWIPKALDHYTDNHFAEDPEAMRSLAAGM